MKKKKNLGHIQQIVNRLNKHKDVRLISRSSRCFVDLNTNNTLYFYNGKDLGDRFFYNVSPKANSKMQGYENPIYCFCSDDEIFTIPFQDLYNTYGNIEKRWLVNIVKNGGDFYWKEGDLYLNPIVLPIPSYRRHEVI